MMTGTLPSMSVSVEAAERPQKETENDNRDEQQLPEALARPSAEELEVARELVRSARARGTALTGPGGLLKALTKTVIETALDEEMADHLGYDKHDPAGENSGNSRNGVRTKTVLTDNCGPVEIEVPRDRNGTFDPTIVKKWQRRSGDDQGSCHAHVEFPPCSAIKSDRRCSRRCRCSAKIRRVQSGQARRSGSR